MSEIYVVKGDEQLSDIARKFNISIDDIINLNNFTSFELRPGQEIYLPAKGFSAFDVYYVKKGDNLYRIAIEYGIDSNTLAAINGLELNEYIYPGQKLLVPRENVKIVVTTDGDTLNTLEQKYNINLQELSKYNRNIYLLPGQLILYVEKE